ncbi:MAG TPA: IPT/TIG domain-containing protein [Planctomycetota bacterium]|nr:IPT/TIG domain-containing protein [Planctomycetota bacterium]
MTLLKHVKFTLAAVLLLMMVSPGLSAGQLPAENPPGATNPGVYFRYFNNVGGDFVSFLDGQTPANSGVSNLAGAVVYPPTGDPPGPPGNSTNSSFDVGVRTQNTNYGFWWTGYINIPTSGVWTFYTTSDDGSVVYIGSQAVEVVNNDGSHGLQERSGTIDLAAGLHTIFVKFKQGGGGHNFGIAWSGPGGAPAKEGIPNNVLFTEPNLIAMPTISPNGGMIPQNVTITGSGGTIYYTTDGSEPTTNATVYTGPFNHNTGGVIKAREYSNTGRSDVRTSGTFTVPGPVFTPNGGPINGSTTISLSSPFGGNIYYSIDGTTPSSNSATALYTGPFTLPNSATVNAIAYTPNGVSVVTSASFVRDDIAPGITEVYSFKTTTAVNVIFTAPVNQASAETTTNYAFTGGLTVASASLLEPNLVRITLNAGTPMVSGTTYGVTVSNVSSTGGAVMPAGITRQFVFYPSGSISRERFDDPGINAAMNSLLTNASYPNSPDISDTLPNFEIPVNAADNYGTRIRGYFYPPATGTYIFKTSSDDNSLVFLGGNSLTSSATQVMNINSWTGSRQYNSIAGGGTGNVQQYTTPAALTANRRYYIEGLQSEGGGGDNFAVAADITTAPAPILPDGAAPIAGANMSPFGVGEPLEAVTIITHPSDKTVVQGSSVTFTVVATGSNLTYAWTKAGSPIGGANGSSYTIPTTVATDAAQYRVIVTNSFGSVTSNPATLTVVSLATPVVSTVSPTAGPSGGGQTVTITGLNFVVGQTLVSFGGTPATSINVTNGGNLTCVTPAHAAGTVDVMVTVFGERSGTKTAAYTFVDPPTITSLNPSNGNAAGGVAVTVNGTNLATTSAITYGGSAVTFSNATATTVDFTTPGHTGAGPNVTITVTTAGGQANATYTIDAPTVAAVTPNQGPLAGGQTVTITGTGFVSGQAEAVFDTTAVAGTTSSYTSMTATTPGHAPGTVDVYAQSFGTLAGPALVGSYTYLDLPTVTGIDQTDGPQTGGQTVTITGTNFPNNLADISVTIAGIAATVTGSTGGTSLTVTTGDASPTTPTGPVIVTTFGTQTSNSFGTYTYLPAPVITTIDFSDGPVGGGQVITITGSNFTGASVTVGGNSAINVVVNGGTLTFTTPAGTAGATTIVVTTNGGTDSTAYTYWDPPTVTAISPNFGPTAGGTSVTITGTNFVAGYTQLTIGANALVGLTVVNTTTITGSTPAGSVGAATVTATTFGTQSGSLNNGFTYNNPPTATAQFLTTAEDIALPITLTGVDPDSDVLNFIVTSLPANGTLTINGASVNYTPNADYNGPDSFTFTVSDAFYTSAPATVNLTVTPVNDVPVGTAQTVTTTEDTAVLITLAGVDSDPEVAQTLSFTITSQPAHGTLSGFNAATGQVTYTPALNYQGADSFTFTVTDDTLAGNVTNLTSVNATVSITVGAANDAPVAVSQNVVTGTGKPVIITLVGQDTDNTVLTYTIGTQPVNGVLSGSGAVVTYTPSLNFIGTDSFTFTVSDGTLTSAAATVTITVTPAPNFSGTPTITPDTALAGQTVLFSAGTSGASTFVWNFGDGTQGTGPNVQHIYTQPGIYVVTVTATSPEGVTSTQQVEVFVGMNLSSGSQGNAALPPGATGILVNNTVGGSGKLKCNFIHRNRSTASGTLAGIKFPATLTQTALAGKAGILTLGKGPLAQSFVFSLDARGKGKATSLPKIEVNLLKSRIRFRVNNRAGLTDLAESIGANWLRGTRTRTPVLVLLPATLQVGTDVFVAMTFQLEYRQIGDSGKASLK